jgi:ABC-type antimicrobial peptide transport system permease subunit
LGATPRDILALVVGQGARLSAIGIVIGVVLAVASTRVLSKLLFRVSALDLVTFGATIAVTLAVALLASYIPARRAAKSDPIVALREE